MRINKNTKLKKAVIDRQHQIIANQYLSETDKGTGRFWWQTMEKARMGEIVKMLLGSVSVNKETKLKLAMLPLNITNQDDDRIAVIVKSKAWT